jgi:hypothetical protein
LRRYLELASRLPRPTEGQIAAFVEHLCYAHSWYKHLPILPPGRPFHFFLDPGAGMSRVVRSDGQFGAQPRSSEECYHHSWFSTDETRERFGFLSNAVVYPRKEILDHDVPSMWDPHLAIDVHLPNEVLAAAPPEVSGLIHPLGTNYRLILLEFGHRLPEWPKDTGGSEQAQRVIERCRRLADGTVPIASAPPDVELDETTLWALQRSDWVLYEMLEPERQRQRDEMVQAARRAVKFVYGP